MNIIDISLPFLLFQFAENLIKWTPLFLPNDDDDILSYRRKIALHFFKKTGMNVAYISWPFLLFQFVELLINQTPLFFLNYEADILRYRRKIALHLIKKTGTNIANTSSPFLISVCWAPNQPKLHIFPE